MLALIRLIEDPPVWLYDDDEDDEDDEDGEGDNDDDDDNDDVTRSGLGGRKRNQGG